MRKQLANVVFNADIFPPSGPRRLAVEAHQRMFERGVRPPWVWGHDRCRSYWGSRIEDDTDVNRPSEYARKPQAIVGFLDSFWRPEVGQQSSVLELGCNAGANLHGLRARGYENLRGAEINPAAIEQLRSTFAELDDVEVTLGSLEDMLPLLPTDSVDVVFTMAVLLHIHPSAGAIFEHMARIARSYVCTVESESTTLPYIFARNYRRVFERHGLAQLRSSRLTEQAFPGLGSDYYGYTARLLRV
ncbi:MAG: methyltransferase domain-containing protein [Solirubrobacterales bacterium]|nr:methyltransferase domain-containing protein [Solirubrobacterales bacterium]